MKRILLALAASFLIVCCGPSKHTIHVEMRHPSKSGIDLNGKIVSVVYMENDNPVSTAFAEGVADGLAYSLEQDYETGEGSVGIYKMPKVQGSDYSSKDSLMALLIDTDADVLFLIDTLAVGEIRMGGSTAVANPSSPDSAYVSTGTMPFKVQLYAFDAMNKDEKVYSFNGSSVAAPYAYSDGRQSVEVLMDRAESSLPELGFEAGKMMSASFKSQWKHEQYSIIYFDNPQWFKAMEHADRYNWKDAMDIWLNLLDTNDMLKRSSAAYNLSVACYMTGDYDLASEWLALSDKENKLPLSDAMHKRIDSRKH